jgi:uncharacterized protein YutE (UPF0331/DUF86 family)
MTGDSKSAVLAKLATMHRHLDELRKRLPDDAQVYLGDRDRQLAVERLCQLVMECAIDANALLLCALGQEPPQSARDGFEGVERRGILDPSLAHQFRATLVSFRHRLVHDYEPLDNRIVHRTARTLLEAGGQYVAAVSAFLAGQP